MNHKIKVSHEVPIKLLDDSVLFNDYDYCLVHLTEEHEEYKDFYVKSIKRGREVLLDNSIFELGEAFDSEKFAKAVEEIKPTYYVVPDVLQDYHATVDKFMSFEEDYDDLPGMRIGVVQGKTWTELVNCYQYMSEAADYVAISFDYDYYLTTGYSPESDKLELWCSGRQRLIQQLIDEGIWNHNKPHHLLGCSLAREFKYYRNIPSIRSCDTSNPIVAGIKGLRYYGDLGLLTKPSVKLADLIESELSDQQKVDIFHNVTKFKEILGRYEDL